MASQSILPPGTKRLSDSTVFQNLRKLEYDLKAEKRRGQQGPTPMDVYRGLSPASIHVRNLADWAIIRPIDIFLHKESQNLINPIYLIDEQKQTEFTKLYISLASDKAKRFLSVEDRENRKDLLDSLRKAVTKGTTETSKKLLRKRITTFVADSLARKILSGVRVSDESEKHLVWKTFYSL